MHGIDADILLRILQGRRLGNGRDGALGSGIGRRGGIADNTMTEEFARPFRHRILLFRESAYRGDAVAGGKAAVDAGQAGP
jgi:hypothetical protein